MYGQSSPFVPDCVLVGTHNFIRNSQAVEIAPEMVQDETRMPQKVRKNPALVVLKVKAQRCSYAPKIIATHDVTEVVVTKEHLRRPVIIHV